MRIGDADASDGVPVVRVVESDAANLPNQTRARLRRDARAWGARGEERIRGKIQKSRQGPRARARVRRRPRGLGGGRARRRRRRGGRRGPGPGASARRRSFRSAPGARRRGRRTPRRSWGRIARRRRPRGVQGVVRVRARPRRRRHRRRRARAVAPRRAGEGGAPRDARQARQATSRVGTAHRARGATRRRRVGRESRGDAGGGRLVRRRRTAEHVKETLDQNQLARRAIACDARPRGAAAKGSRGERGAAVNGDRTRTEDSETLATLTRAQVGRRASRIGRRRGGRRHPIPTRRRFFRVTRTQINLHFLKTTTGSAMIVSAPVGGRPSQC